MFQNSKAFSSFSVDDLAKAKTFYQDLLEIEVADKDEVLELHVPGAGNVLLYPKPDHTPATFTVLNFSVSDISKAVAALEAKGVPFEDYDLPGIKTDEHHIFRDEHMGIKIAWFHDPAGNILSVIEAS